MDKIIVKGAREHNLKNIDVELPRDKLIVITGLSGSGKSSLAFDTIYAEGQRRYVESLSRLRAPVPRADGQARHRLDRGAVAGHLHRAEVDLARTRARPSAPSPRSTTTCACSTRASAWCTAATAASRIASQTVQQMVDRVLELPEGTRFSVLAPMVRDRKGEYKKELESLQASRASCASTSTASCTICPSPSSSTRTRSTPSRSTSIAWRSSPTSASA